MLRQFAIAGALVAAFASRAAAQDTARPDSVRSNVLETVTVTAKKPANNVFTRFWHMEEDRKQVLAMEAENRRLAAQLRGYDRQIVKLENRLTVVKAEHDRKLAVIATTDSLTADARRRRMELEERLRQLEGTGTVATTAVRGGSDAP